MFSEPKDPRESSKYPNYQIVKTPSGHTIFMDDTENNESMTIQHRTGSMVQFHPDGTVHIRSNKDKYEIVLGDGKTKITGSYDIVVDGGGSLEVKGDYDLKVLGDMNATIQGNYKTIVGGHQETVVAKDQVNAVRGDRIDSIIGNFEMMADGTAFFGGDGGVTITSPSSGLNMTSEKNMAIESGGVYSTKSAGAMMFKSDSTYEVTSDGNMTLVGSIIHLNP